MRLFLMFVFSTILLHAQESEPTPSSKNPDLTSVSEQANLANAEKNAITRLENGQMQIGEVTFDPKSRQIRVPSTVNMAEGLLEFALVHENGKIHESLLITTASPLHINIALKMLRYTPSEELYYIEKEKGVSSGKYPTVEENTRKAARVELLVEFSKGGKTVTMPLRDAILNDVTQKSMETDEWIYGGSLMYDGKFHAETSGDIASIYVSRGSLILFAGKENQNDEVWIAHTKRLPDVGTKATFIIQPSSTSPKKIDP